MGTGNKVTLKVNAKPLITQWDAGDRKSFAGAEYKDGGVTQRFRI